MSNITLKVEGMSCGHCVSAVEGAVGKLGASAKVDLAGKSVAIEYDESKTSVASLKEAIEDQGYDVV
ncbi:copper ion binding protein [Cohnella fermenti]|uniref:Heavy-metal-associated domain-containing protein n=1 Tax=Cohnella fermenti TaxID=2565925 RepID=A0A4S4BF07_9BACL|nr:copper ion binding protein [Cohnella fermenti]THF72867.1 heavy-metal-associated domain-containing protein [Cohnella fermenti]